jgi:hypothetical protein
VAAPVAAAPGKAPAAASGDRAAPGARPRPTGREPDHDARALPTVEVGLSPVFAIPAPRPAGYGTKLPPSARPARPAYGTKL